MVGDVGQVVVTQLDRGETALLVPKGTVEGFLLGTAGAAVGKPPAQVHLPGDERDQRDRAPPGARLDELGELLGLAAEEGLVAHREGQPQHELVEEEHDGVVPQRLDRKSTRLNSSHVAISYAVLCLAKKN